MKHDMKLWKEYSEGEQQRLIQLMEDMIPYYERIAVYDVDREFIRANRERCMGIALAARKLVTEDSSVSPGDAIFSDELFGTLVTAAWQNVFDGGDRAFFNSHLQQAAECFRMGIMMADLPEV